MAARSRAPTPRQFWAWPMSTARWWGAPAWTPPNSPRSSPRVAAGSPRPGADIMQTVVLVIHLLIAIALVGLVLLQRSEGGGLGLGGGGGGGFMTARGTANLLTRSTAILAGCFVATSLALAILSGTG